MDASFFNFSLTACPMFTPSFFVSSVRVSIKATDGTSGVHGFTLWDKGEEKRNVGDMWGTLEMTEEREISSKN